MAERPHLDFERPITELEKKISDMKDFSVGESVELSGEIASLQKKLEKLRGDVYSKLTRWQKVQIARHPLRPYSMDYIRLLSEGFLELHGDRGYGDDKALVGGFARIGGKSLMIIGQQKGRDTKEKLIHNFGMMHPEGYRKALRLFYMAQKFKTPILILIDTPGAYPGIEAEERGQAEAIARNIREMAVLEVPIVVVIIGEGASGGALGIGLGDRIIMLEYSWYSVISPEGCAAILWRDAAKAPDAAEALKVTSQDVLELGVIDQIIPEPSGGAHNDPEKTAESMKIEILKSISELEKLSTEQLIEQRIKKYRIMGVFDE
ncbi:MAG: acetyl-CoA carboxylase carboxyltransferase subunit alpha [candidate division Zixibacteria bacterium]|nr:acetyl-CoA carboxylase carboxyltransferase subunit alpha [candidate division Zixibacteria bacterium]